MSNLPDATATAWAVRDGETGMFLGNYQRVTRTYTGEREVDFGDTPRIFTRRHHAQLSAYHLKRKYPKIDLVVSEVYLTTAKPRVRVEANSRSLNEEARHVG